MVLFVSNELLDHEVIRVFFQDNFVEQNVLCELQQVLVVLDDGTDFRKAPFHAPLRLAFFKKDMTNAIPQTHRVIVR